MATAVLVPNCQGESCFDMIGLRVGKGVPWRPALLELAFDRHGGFRCTNDHQSPRIHRYICASSGLDSGLTLQAR